MSPFPILGVSGVFFHFLFYVEQKFLYSKGVDPDQKPHSVPSDVCLCPFYRTLDTKLLGEPSHEIIVLFVLRKHYSANAHAQPSSGTICLIFGRTLRLLPYFMCANSEGSGKTARIRRLA